jgi:hypothetical protein
MQPTERRGSEQSRGDSRSYESARRPREVGRNSSGDGKRSVLDRSRYDSCMWLKRKPVTQRPFRAERAFLNAPAGSSGSVGVQRSRAQVIIPSTSLPGRLAPRPAGAVPVSEPDPCVCRSIKTNVSHPPASAGRRSRAGRRVPRPTDQPR